MTSLHHRLTEAAGPLSALTEHPLREARLLLAHVLGLSYTDLYFTDDRLLTEAEEKEFSALLRRRLTHEPLSKILGVREFWSLPFRVTADTLDPRPDSETLIEAVLAYFPDKTHPWRILDLGTGTGCLLLTLLHEYPQAWGVGVDCSEAAIQVAQDNAAHLKLLKRASFSVASWGEALNGCFDIIISNPPYIGRLESLPPEVALYDPEGALYGGEDGLACYRALAAHLPPLLAPDGKIVLEMGAGQAQALSDIFSPSQHFSCLQLSQDLKGKDRCMVFSYHKIAKFST